MSKKNKLKLLLALALMATPAIAQPLTNSTKKCEARAHEFADFLLYWADWYAYESVSRGDKRRAERTTYTEAQEKIPELTRDSTYMANKITKGANIINQKFDLNERPDHIYTWYELFYIYEKKNADKNSAEYILADDLKKYQAILKELKLNRYTMRINQK